MTLMPPIGIAIARRGGQDLLDLFARQFSRP